MNVPLDKIKAIRDYWKAGNNQGRMAARFPEMDPAVIRALTLEDSDGKDYGLTLEQYQQALQKIPNGATYQVIGPIVRAAAGRTP